MKAFVVERYGSKDGVRLVEMPQPELRDDDVLVEVHAAGVNPLDSKIRDGEFKLILPYRLRRPPCGGLGLPTAGGRLALTTEEAPGHP
jgi:NADPH:quinone reductase-like Zn-dependent oxidoreductase